MAAFTYFFRPRVAQDGGRSRAGFCKSGPHRSAETRMFARASFLSPPGFFSSPLYCSNFSPYFFLTFKNKKSSHRPTQFNILRFRPAFHNHIFVISEACLNSFDKVCTADLFIFAILAANISSVSGVASFATIATFFTPTFAIAALRCGLSAKFGSNRRRVSTAYLDKSPNFAAYS